MGGIGSHSVDAMDTPHQQGRSARIHTELEMKRLSYDGNMRGPESCQECREPQRCSDSKLSEGQQTRVRGIEEALKQDFAAEPAKRGLRGLALPAKLLDSEFPQRLPLNP